ncbi:gp159 [Bacillus phage W.Ph.]|uniref:Gp159 n=1 Tax=Bacillus phage W.Ph. TaxID=764595 RepID=G9B1R0_9CAUD|nr:gp159 [Bacillus phage W.Ph.]ADH03305.1 gp159 [Bacillus phage W.Ph.]
MSGLQYFTCTMTAEITRTVEAQDAAHALELVDENDMIYELKNYKTDYEMSAKPLMRESQFNFQNKMLIAHNIFAYLVDDKPVKVTRAQYEFFKSVYDAMDVIVKLNVMELENENKVILSLGRYK